MPVQRTTSAASTNATSVKAAASRLVGWSITNANASQRFVKIYDKASTPTVGTDTPILTIGVAANSDTSESGLGIPISNGLAFATTTAAADSDTGAVGEDDLIIQLWYE